jgi:hypothetical protein
MSEINHWVLEASTDLKTRLEGMSQMQAYGQVTLIFTLQNGVIIDYVIGDDIRKRVQKVPTYKTKIDSKPI